MCIINQKRFYEAFDCKAIEDKYRILLTEKTWNQREKELLDMI